VADDNPKLAPDTPTSGPTLQLEGIHKSYSTGTAHETEVLHGIDLTLARGEFVALIGPSGSGKSTLLNIIGLLDKPSAGKLFLTGQEAENLPDKALTRLRGDAIGFVFQFHNLLPAFTAVENVMLPLLAVTAVSALSQRWGVGAVGVALLVG
jgi:lipoprotein-releasing system ATP-binding protein